MTLAGRFRIPASHPSLPGHFPGRPVVPGVVLLDEVFSIAVALYPGFRVAGAPRVKFMAPVRPDDEVLVLTSGAEGRVAFACTVDGRDVLAGALLLAPA